MCQAPPEPMFQRQAFYWAGTQVRHGWQERKDPMTNNKKLNAQELATIQGGGAKAGAKPSGLAKASSGRVAPKAVNLGAKKR